MTAHFTHITPGLTHGTLGELPAEVARPDGGVSASFVAVSTTKPGDSAALT